MPTGIGWVAVSPASTSNVSRAAKPAASLPTRPRTTTLPASLITAMS